MPKGKKGLIVDIALPTWSGVASFQGAVRAHITWAGVDPKRPKSSLLNISFYNIDNNIVRLCEKHQIPVRVPWCLEYAVDSQTLSSTDVGHILNEIRSLVVPTSSFALSSLRRQM